MVRESGLRESMRSPPFGQWHDSYFQPRVKTEREHDPSDDREENYDDGARWTDASKDGRDPVRKSGLNFFSFAAGGR